MKKKARTIWIILFILMVIANYIAFFMNYKISASSVLNYISGTASCLGLGLWLGEK